MSLCTVAGHQVSRGTLRLVLDGPSTFECELIKNSSTVPAEGTVAEVKCGSFTFSLFCTLVTAANERYRVVGVLGKDDIREEFGPLELVQPSLEDVIRSLGLSGTFTIDKAHSFPRYIIAKQRRVDILKQVAANALARHRYDIVSNAWVYEEPTKTFDLKASADNVVIQDSNKTLQFGLKEALTVRPGHLFEGKSLKDVTYVWTGKNVTCTALYGDISGEDDLFDKRVRKIVAYTTYHHPHSAVVIQQNSDGTVDVKPQSEDIPELSSVPIATVPGIELKGIEADSLCFIQFLDGDPGQPFVTLMPMTTGLTDFTVTASNQAKITGTSKIILDGGSIEIGAGASKFLGDVAGLISAINTLVSSINANIIAYNACVPIPGTPLGSTSPQLALTPIVPTAYVSTVAKVKL